MPGGAGTPSRSESDGPFASGRLGEQMRGRSRRWWDARSLRGAGADPGGILVEKCRRGRRIDGDRERDPGNIGEVCRDMVAWPLSAPSVVLSLGGEDAARSARGDRREIGGCDTVSGEPGIGNVPAIDTRPQRSAQSGTPGRTSVLDFELATVLVRAVGSRSNLHPR